MESTIVSRSVHLPVWMSAPQLEPQPIGQRPTARIENPGQANSQLRQLQRADAPATDNRSLKRGASEMERETSLNEEEENDPSDTVRLWEEGWRERYYKNKFNVGKQDLEEFRIHVAQHYARGLCWVLQYYYQGVPAWDWFVFLQTGRADVIVHSRSRYFPYHYAPFASDFLRLKDLSVAFDGKTKPFKPLEQLMAVFPSQSRKFLPSEWQTLMLEKESPIIDFYPLNFCVDLNGKRYEWQGVALLPFVDEKRLSRTLEHVYPTLNADEQQRNKRDYDRLYIHSSSLCYDSFNELYAKKADEVTRRNPLDMPTMLSGGMAGRIWPDDEDKVKAVGEPIKAPLPNCEDIEKNQVVCVKYRDLLFDDGYIFKAKLLENVTLPSATLRPRDYDQSTPFRPNTGFAQRPQFQRDFAPAHRFVRHAMGHQQQQQQSGGFFPERQQGQYNSYNNYNRPQYQHSTETNYRHPSSQQHYQNDYSAPRHNIRPRMPHQQQQQRPYNNYNNYNNNNQRPNMNGGGGSWS